jgi:hypothetical protein
MVKHNKANKAHAPAEGALSVTGKALAPNATTMEHGNPDPTPSNQLEIIGDGSGDSLSLTFPEVMTQPEYYAYGVKMGHALQGASWRVGDYVNFGKAKFGIKDYAALADEVGLDEVYLRQCSSIASRVPAEHRALASLERFRLLLPKREKIVKDGKTAGEEEIPLLVGRFAEWTAREIRAGAKDKPKELTAADTGTAAHTTDDDSANADAGQKETEREPADAALAAAKQKPDDPAGAMTATAVYETARKLQIGIELLTPERLAVLAIMEQKFPVIRPLVALGKILCDQIRTELHKA